VQVRGSAVGSMVGVTKATHSVTDG
jgi:hypothetical protein